MNHSTITPENGNDHPTTSTTQDLDFSALMNFKPEMTQDQLKIASEVFNENAVFVRVAFALLTKTPQQLLASCRDDPEFLDSVLEELEKTNGYIQSLSQLISSAYHRLLVVGGYVLQVEGGAA